jgi:biopolymer transport protein ExbD
MMKRRRYSRNAPTLKHEINVTPFVDVMLVLLIIFMVSAPMMQKEIPIDLPQAGAGADSAGVSKSLVVSINAENLIFLNEQPVSADELIQILKSQPPECAAAPIVLRAHEKLSYEHVIHIMDLLRRNGFCKIALTVKAVA